jgi:hypothetical protein
MLLQQNLLHNPILQEYVTNVEWVHPDFGVSVLPSSVVERIVGTSRDRSPIPFMDSDASSRLMSVVVSVMPDAFVARPHGKSIFRPGNLIRRDDSSRDSTVIEVWLNGLPAASSGHLSTITLEQALVPFLFPFGSGAYDGTSDFCEYIRMRLSAICSPFTLYPPYLMFMFQMRQLGCSLTHTVPCV